MSSTGVGPDSSMETPARATIDLKLGVVTRPVPDVDRAKGFYQSSGWRLDTAIVRGEGFRVIQLTPPSECSISFGKGLATAAPGSSNEWLLHEITPRLAGREWED
jgi:hypothetical protein